MQERKLRRHDIVIALLIASFIVIAGLLVWTLIQPDPEPVEPPTTGDVWDRVQASGKLIVGTSADYPPFDYYDSNYQLDGFDIALIREIGQRLGLEVEVRDMIFDDLPNALELEQVDVSIAAISVTEERDQVIDFSNVYFVSEDAVLAREGSGLTAINSLPAMAPYRVGVQRSTVYENEIRTNLIDTGQMRADQLFVYSTADTAVADLSAGRIDLVWLDLQPAEVATNISNVIIVGQGLSRQKMAIATKNGQSILLGKLNDTLTTMQNEGRVAQLVLDYMGIPPDQILPPPTPAPTTAPLPTGTPLPCIDGMRFVEDLNLDDNGMQTPPQMPPGVPFKKGWRLQNTGTCTWDSTYYLGYAGGSSPAAQMGGQPTPVNGTVVPGAYYDMWVDLVSPLTPGVYQGFWVMHNGANAQFGDRIWVGIEVVGAATSTPVATATASPNVQFTVDRTQIQAGECVLFNWNVTGATAVYFYPQGQSWQPNQVPAQSSRTECPPQTTTYELRVIWPDGSFEISPITISVVPVAGAPVIERFTLYPPTEIFAGQCVELTWIVSGQVDVITISRDNTVIYSNAPLSGSLPDCPPGSGLVQYSILAAGPGGNSRQQQTLNVVLPSTQPPPPTATPEVKPPTIQSFSVRPEVITQGECVDVTWSVAGDASLIQIKRDGIVVLDNAGYSGIVQDCLNNPGVVAYRIEASNPVGDFAWQDAAVQVDPITDPNLPLSGTLWRLTDYWDGQGAVRAVLQGSEVTATFESNGQLTGSAGCNSYNADYALFSTEGIISIGVPSGTGQLCSEPPGIMEQEQAYLSTLPTVATYEITGEIMVMKDGTGRDVLRFDGGPVATPFGG